MIALVASHALRGCMCSDQGNERKGKHSMTRVCWAINVVFVGERLRDRGHHDDDGGGGGDDGGEIGPVMVVAVVVLMLLPLLLLLMMMMMMMMMEIK